ncbi:TetR/AcrR family transcriptional regulator [Primorskyibacter aestuariivivens]|uniref:TetR/AcrR family transcriptional regulator n=1 Tax=Primorskyibacter aestuariivivens TaxID=1888912 RepID=UPI0023002AF3|nr:TetR/AcrR family transcriptional regulator [Primorskyibacter aestuariivivens]MDA7429883.1 TetR/AcrR family transcriptional regulator [Primorskyibacter aestuariivivens]
MKESRRAERREQIESAAYALLIERGYAGTSMLEIAKRARASNETLYRWYGDKPGLFAAMIRSNAEKGLRALSGTLDTHAELEPRLHAFGAALLGGILSDQAIALNRAAAADSSGELGAALARHGRDAVMPVLAAELGGLTGFDTEEEAAETFVALLIGDLQIRRVIGQMAAPDAAFCARRAGQATRHFLKLASG